MRSADILTVLIKHARKEHKLKQLLDIKSTTYDADGPTYLAYADRTDLLEQLFKLKNLSRYANVRSLYSTMIARAFYNPQLSREWIDLAILLKQHIAPSLVSKLPNFNQNNHVKQK